MLKFFQLIRFQNLLILFLTQWFVKAFIINHGTNWSSMVTDFNFYILAISTVIIASAGYIINDYYDIKIDLINKPEKTLIGRVITRRRALVWHLSLTFTGVLLGFYNGLLVGLLHCLSAFLLWFYSNTLKRQPLSGNICIAFLSGLSIYMVAVLYRDQYLHVFIYSLFAFYISFIREVIKDIQDLKGDSTFGCRTLPILWGIRRTKKVIYGIIVLFIVNIMLFFPLFTFWMIVYMFVLVIFPLLLMVYWIDKSDTLKDFRNISSYCKMIMLTGIGSLIFLS